MGTERTTRPGPPVAWQTSPPPASGGVRRWLGRNVGTILVGAAVSFAVMSVLYGFNNATMLVAVLVICTVGVGLIPIILVSWLAGWVVVAVWDAVRRQLDQRGGGIARGAPGA